MAEMNNCCCNWADVNNFFNTYNTTVESVPGEWKAQYLCDFAYRRKDKYQWNDASHTGKTLIDDPVPYSAQGVCWIQNGLVLCSRINQREGVGLGNVAFTLVDLTTNTVRMEQLFTGSDHSGHHNNIVKVEEITDGVWEIWTPNVDHINRYELNTNTFSMHYLGRMDTTPGVRVATLMHDDIANTFWYGGSGDYGTLSVNDSKTEAACNIVFHNDKEEEFVKFYNLNSRASQSAVIHDGKMYITFSYPAMWYVYDLTGAFLGVKGIKAWANGYPIGENEGLTWCEPIGAFIMLCASRFNDALEVSGYPQTEYKIDDPLNPRYHWYHTYLYAIGDSVIADENPYNLTGANAGSTAMGTGRVVYCKARVMTDIPAVGDITYHTGSTANPFDFPEEAAAYTWGYGERDTGRVTLVLNLEGDFTAYQPTCRIGGDIEVQLNHCKLHQMTINQNTQTYIHDVNYTDASGDDISYIYFVNAQANAVCTFYCACRLFQSNGNNMLAFAGLRGAELDVNGYGNKVHLSNSYNLDQVGGYSDQVHGHLSNCVFSRPSGMRMTKDGLTLTWDSISIN